MDGCNLTFAEVRGAFLRCSALRRQLRRRHREQQQQQQQQQQPEAPPAAATAPPRSSDSDGVSSRPLGLARQPPSWPFVFDPAALVCLDLRHNPAMALPGAGGVAVCEAMGQAGVAMVHLKWVDGARAVTSRRPVRP